MIDCPSVRKQAIRTHYDLSTLFYRLLWGPHIHHGLWEGQESVEVAQQQLIDTMIKLADVRRGDRVLDVGCGMGGSSIYLAKQLDCTVTGVTLSPVQRRWAGCSAWWQGVGKQVTIRCQDAETLELPEQSIDVLWSIECTEHLFDKAAFFRRAAKWLRPGGRVVICAWLAGPNNDESTRRQVYDVCEGFLCPSLGTMQDYATWLTDAGWQVTNREDWTSRVLDTWPICRKRVEKTGVRWLAKPLGQDAVRFLDRFDTIDQAYRSGAMQYGCLVARAAE